MKICNQLIQGTQIYDEDGSVRVCAWFHWQYQNVGKLTEQTMEEIWRGEKVRKIFERIASGDFSMCNPNDCPFLASAGGKLDNVPFWEIEEIPPYPTYMNLSYEKVCNYKCKICAEVSSGNFAHYADAKCNTEREEKRKLIEKNLESTLPHLIRIGANGGGELMASKHTLELLSKWKPNNPEKVHVRLETNGSLFDEEHWRKIENLAQYPVTVVVTVMSFDEPTYQYLHGVKYPISKVENNLRFIRSLRERGIVNHFEITTVMQERNFRTLPQWFKRCIEEFDPDSVRIRPYSPYGFNPPAEWVWDIRGKDHPYHEEYLEMIKDPIFKHPKFNDWGIFYSHEHPVPYLKDKKCREWESEILCQMLSDDSGLVKLENLVQENGGKVIIHGAGVLGRTIAKNLTERGNVKIDHITDFRQCGEFLGIPIINLNAKDDLGNPIPNSQDKTLPVLVTWLETEQRHFDYFRSLGYTGKFIKLNEIFDYNCGCDCK